MQFARPSSPQKQAVDLGGLVSEALGGLRGLAEERQVQLQGPEQLPALTLLVDGGQIRQTLVALLRNAIEACKATGWVRLEVKQAPAGAVHFIVEDSGPGPTVTDRVHLFDPFYSGRKAGRGRGLGLPTAWRLARLHQGEVRCEDTAPTRFVLILPASAVCLPLRNGSHMPAATDSGQPTGIDLPVTAEPVPVPARTAAATTPELGMPLASGNGIPAHS
jgi:signal transduction histidine kinase